jgi:hypothetical protein
MDNVTKKGSVQCLELNRDRHCVDLSCFWWGSLRGSSGAILGVSCHGLLPRSTSIKGSLAWPSVTLVYVESSPIPLSHKL